MKTKTHVGIGLVFALGACGDSSSEDRADAGRSDIGSNSDAGNSTGADDSGVTAPSDSGANGTPDAGNAQCAGCSTQQGCFVATVTRSPIDGDMPWSGWPDLADGVGTLVVGVDETQRVVVRKADFRQTKASYDLTLCVKPGSYPVYAFLDDDEDAEPTQIQTGDYVDSCPMDRAPPANAVTLGSARPVAIILAGTCD